jgi:hypothetical protein
MRSAAPCIVAGFVGHPTVVPTSASVAHMLCNRHAVVGIVRAWYLLWEHGRVQAPCSRAGWCWVPVIAVSQCPLMHHHAVLSGMLTSCMGQ